MKLSPEELDRKIDEIEQYINDGWGFIVACRMVGFDERVVYPLIKTNERLAALRERTRVKRKGFA